MADYYYTASGTFGVALCGPLIVVAYPNKWERKEFVEFIELLVKLKFNARSILVFANGQKLSAAERRELIERVPPPKNAPPMRQALLTNSSILRGVLTAVGWLTNKPDYAMRAFAVSELATAVEWLKVTATFADGAASESLRTMLPKIGTDPKILD